MNAHLQLQFIDVLHPMFYSPLFSSIMHSFISIIDDTFISYFSFFLEALILFNQKFHLIKKKVLHHHPA